MNRNPFSAGEEGKTAGSRANLVSQTNRIVCFITGAGTALIFAFVVDFCAGPDREQRPHEVPFVRLVRRSDQLGLALGRPDQLVFHVGHDRLSFCRKLLAGHRLFFSHAFSLPVPHTRTIFRSWRSRGAPADSCVCPGLQSTMTHLRASFPRRDSKCRRRTRSTHPGPRA